MLHELLEHQGPSVQLPTSPNFKDRQTGNEAIASWEGLLWGNLDFCLGKIGGSAEDHRPLVSGPTPFTRGIPGLYIVSVLET